MSAVHDFLRIALIMNFVVDRQESRQKSRHFIDEDGTYLYLLNPYKFVLRRICLVDSPAKTKSENDHSRWPIDAQKVFVTHNTIIADDNKI